MILDDKDVTRFAIAVTRLDEVITKLSAGNTNKLTVSVNAGGIGVTICAICCAVVLIAVILTSVYVAPQLTELRASNNALRAHLSAIYQKAPQLAPKEERK